MNAPEPPAVPDREARREAERARRDAEAEQRALADARIDAAAAAAPSVLPGGVGEALAAVLAAMKPFRAADGHLAFSAVGRSSDEVVALSEAILALPADAVRLVPESEVQFVLDDNERMLAQHASDVAEIERLREDKRLFQDMFMSATAHNTAVCEALGLSYEAETETVVAAIQKALHPMLMLDSETGAVSLAAAVPDTGQDRDDIRGWLHEQIEAGGDPMLARVLDALNEPSGATVQTPHVADLAYARSEVDKWLDDGDPYCILPTRTEHIPALLARLDELEGTR